MTNPGDATSDSLSDDPTSTVRYRYYQQPPKTIFVEWSELVDLVPADVITEGKNFAGVMIGLPAEEIFEGIIPRIRYGRLQQLLPEGTLQLPGDRQNEFLYIPASRIARHYQMTTLREALPEEPKPVAPVVESPKVEIKPEEKVIAKTEAAPVSSVETPVVFSQPVISPVEKQEEKPPEIKFAAIITLPQPETRVASQQSVEKPVAQRRQIDPIRLMTLPQPGEEARVIVAESPSAKEILETPVSLPKENASTPVAAKVDVEKPAVVAAPEVKAEKETPVEDPGSITLPPRPEVPRTPLILPKPEMPIVAQASPANESLDPQQKRSFFDRLPLFRKKPEVEAAEEAPPVIIKPIHTNLPPRQVPPPVPALKKATQKISVEKPSIEVNLPPPVVELPTPEPEVTLMVSESKESALDIRAKEEIPQPAVLQSLFMTDEALTIERTVELSSGLPGIRSCVLARGAGIIASANVPAGIDVVALSTNAMNMLRQMQESLQKMGMGSIPAVTLHSEKGPVSVLPYEDLCMLIFHKDRAFIPGVRERLQDVLKELSHANLPLALETDIKKAPEVA